MKLHHTTAASSWQTYKALELIPATVPPQANKLSFTGLHQIWRLLLTALTQELVYHDQKIEYLERCWAENLSQQNDSPNLTTLQKLWTLMN